MPFALDAFQTSLESRKHGFAGDNEGEGGELLVRLRAQRLGRQPDVFQVQVQVLCMAWFTGLSSFSITDDFDECCRAYHNELIQKVFTIIERDTLTPQERARMKDEYGYEQIGQDQFAKGQTQGKQETALAMLQEGLDPALIAKVTGLSAETITDLANHPRGAQDA